jgi:vacuolar-type H+-ATPase subunit E/Vma4
MADRTDRDDPQAGSKAPLPAKGETIESFVAKLRQEGVQAGRADADQIRAEARQQAKDIVAQAQRQAETIVAEANTRAEETLARSRTDLDLAARDAVLRLQEALSRALTAVLGQHVKQHLEDHEFLGRLLHEIVLLYVQADFERRGVLNINVRPEMREKLVAWAFREIGEDNVQRVRPSIDLKGVLTDAGFEYTYDGSTVEVTRESVVEALMDLVGPALRETIANAAAGQKEA